MYETDLDMQKQTQNTVLDKIFLLQQHTVKVQFRQQRAKEELLLWLFVLYKNYFS